MKSTLYRTKTAQMQEWYPSQKVRSGKNDFQVISSDLDFASTNETRFASVGSSLSPHCREIFTYKADDLEIPYVDFANDDRLTDLDKISYLMLGVDYLAQDDDAEENLYDLIRFWGNGHNAVQIIPLKAIEESGAMVCRHRAALLATVMGGLVKEGKLSKGSVRIYRDVLTKDDGAEVEGGHGWVVYTDFEHNRQYLLEPSFREIYDLTDEDDLQRAKRFYGQQLIIRMQARIENADAKVNKKMQLAKLNKINADMFFSFANKDSSVAASSSQSSAPRMRQAV